MATKLWYTLAGGNLGEVFFPSLDRTVLQELRFIAAAPGLPPVDDLVEGVHSVRWIHPGVPGFEVSSSHHEYHLKTEYLVDTSRNALLIAGDFNPELPDLRLHLTATPHLLPLGPGNSAEIGGGTSPVLFAQQGDVFIAIVGPFARAAAGYRDSSDLHVDLHDNDGEMRSTATAAGPGNVTVGAELAIHAGAFQIAIAFAHSKPDAEEAARELLRQGAAATRTELISAWSRLGDLPPLMIQVAGDGGQLAKASLTVLRSLEDKSERGGFVASPSAPWGEQSGDGEHVYNLVWARDLYQVATALIDAGDSDAAARGLRHLARIQHPDGSWPQNSTLAGEAHWRGVELDEAAYPILLARRLKAAGALDWDPWPQLVRRAAQFIIRTGPTTPLDRWEDAGGLSPSTLAAAIAALVAAAEFGHAAGEHVAAAHLLAVADYWADCIERWCFAPGPGHFVRLSTDPDLGPGPAAVLSTDFLELVRLGVRSPTHPAVIASLRRVDADLIYLSPVGASWRRYAGDEYGEHADGAPWDLGGIGRPWPLLTGERAHYELLRGIQVGELVRAFESFAGPGLMLPEQIWDSAPVPAYGLLPGVATNSAAPLGWAHAEYLKLLASIANARVGDLVPAVRDRYCEAPPHEPPFMWSPNHEIATFQHGHRFRVQLTEPATVRWSADEWTTYKESPTVDTTLGFHVAELPTQIMRPGAELSWTIHYADRWEGRNRSLTCR
ncbi:MAG: glucan 1,4-alpha-glucosidase [Candidatus Dormibacteraceae bacterium]